jgi:alpha-beta hydrolase superfamily lysophospholipase
MKFPAFSPRQSGLWLAAASLLAIGCQSPAGVRELSKPMAFDPVLKPLLDPDRLSPESLAVLQAEDLGKIHRNDPAAAVRALGPAAVASPELDPRRLALAEILCNEAASMERSDTSGAIGWYLDAARLTYPAAIDSQDTGDHTRLLALYNHACGQVAELAFHLRTRPGEPLRIRGPLSEQTLEMQPDGPTRFDPAYFDVLKISEYLQVKGYQKRETVPGVGGALVGHRSHTPERVAEDPFLPEAGMALPVTATLHFPATAARPVELALHDVLVTDRVRLGSEEFHLAADFTAPLALLSSLEPSKNIGRRAMFHPAKFLGSTGLHRLEPQRDDKIPVVLVHGLSKTPAVWSEAINELRSDPAIRERYQFFVFQYPSGFPAGFCASALRQRLERYRELADPRGANPHHRRMVLVGKSFGGVISSFQVRDSGEKLRELFATRPIAELDLPEHQRQTLQSILHFRANPDISRVVFMVTPHLGTDVADTPLSKTVSRIIRYPFDLVTDGALQEFEGMTDLARAYVNEPPNSMMNLRPHSPVLEAVKSMPTRPGLPIHSIIGKVGNGPLEASNDKMVPYWSSHLGEADSEIVVPTKHGNITHHPDSISELRRILRLHLEG